MVTKARIEITAKDRTRGALRSVESSLRTVNRAVFSLQGAIAGVVGAAGFGAMISQSLKAGDAMGKTADKLGVATDALTGLRLAAERTAGVTGTQLDTALQRLARRASEAAAGTGTLKAELEALGINVQAFNNLTVDEQFSQLGEAMQGVTNQGDRLRIAMAAFDVEGAALEATLAAGADGLDEFRDKAIGLGIALDRGAVAGIEAANDSLGDLSSIVKGIGLQTTADLAGGISMVSDRLVQWALDNQFVAKTSRQMAENTVAGFAVITDAVNVVQMAWNGLKLVVVGTVRNILGAIENLMAGMAAMAEVIPGIGDAMAAPFLSAEAALANLDVSLKNTLVDIHAGIEDHVEFMQEWTEIERELWAGLGQAAEDAATQQNNGMESVEKQKKKHVLQHLRNEKAMKDLQVKANMEKINSTNQYTNAAISLGNALFGETKGLAIASIIADTAAGIAKTWAQLGWPAAIPGTVAIAASGAAQLAAARGASKGGGGSISAGGGGAGAIPTSPVLQEPDLVTQAEPSRNVSISLTGGLYSGEDVRELIRAINEEIGDGAELVTA